MNIPKIKRIFPNDDYSVTITYANGEKRVFHMAPYLNRGVFRILKNRRIFNKARIAFNTVVWPHDVDIAPETLYRESIKRH